MRTDYHLHLAPDDEPLAAERLSVEHVARYVEAARAAGVEEIGFSEHVYRFARARDWLDEPSWRAGAVADLSGYVAALAEAQAAGLPVRIGLEVDHLPGGAPSVAELAGEHEWDFLLGSVHRLGPLEVDNPGNSAWEAHAAEEVWARYVELVCDAAQSGLYDVLAHADLAKVFGRGPGRRAAAFYEAIADAAEAGGVCVEVSTAGLRKPAGELYPAAPLLALLGRRGVPVTLASDAHEPRLVGHGYCEALRALTVAGYRTITSLRRRERRQVPLS